MLEKVRLYVRSMTKGRLAKDDLKTKKVELKSNQSTPLAPAMTTTPRRQSQQ